MQDRLSHWSVVKTFGNLTLSFDVAQEDVTIINRIEVEVVVRVVVVVVW